MSYFYGYNIVVAGFIIQAVCIGAMFTYGVFFEEFQAEFGWSRATISSASSLAFLIMGAVGILAGRLNDRIGPRFLMIGTGISLGFGYLLLFFLHSPWQLYLLYGLLVGIGLSTHDVITLSTVARWFIKRRGIMSGIVKVGTGAGQLVVPLLATALISTVGWRHAYLIIGAAVLVILVLVALPLRRAPQEIGLLPDGDAVTAGGAPIDAPASDLPLNRVTRSMQFWIICLVEFSIFFCLLTIVVHVVPYATDRGLAPVTAASVLSTIGGASMVGRIVMGAANDKIGGKRSLIICFIILLCALLWLQWAEGSWVLFVFAVIHGFAHGGFFTVVSPTIAELFGTESHGLLFGLVLFSGTIGGSVGPLLAGHNYDLTGNYETLFLLLTLLAMIGLILTALLRPLIINPSAPS